MWFKNVYLFRVHSEITLAVEQIAEQMACYAAKPLGDSDARRIGWTPPAKRLSGGQLLHETHGHRLFTALRQERMLPAAVVKDEVDEQVAAIEQTEGRKVSRREKAGIKEQVVEELLPRAFIRKERLDLWFDTTRNLIGVNTSNRSRAEDVLDLLRETLGSLKVTPLSSQTLPITAMTTWLGDPAARPADFTLGDQVELKAKGDDGVVKGRQVDLDSDEMQQLLESGRHATKLALGIEGKISFILQDDLALKSLRFGDALIEEADFMDDGDDPLARIQTDFLLMDNQLGDDVDRLLVWLGGETQREPASQ